ncbi:MAG: chemotaxis protein CheD [Oligoflexia bacterium]|nr:chemotaxis protein CheD [Oligoflexia bacterium]
MFSSMPIVFLLLMKLKQLNTGDAGLGCDQDILSTDGVGSCVVLCLWDPIRKIGAMAHMSQASTDKGGAMRPFSFGSCPELAIPFLLKRMLARGSLACDICVRIVGGGNMFYEIKEGSLMDIGTHIVHATLETLNQEGLHLTSSALGGKFGRSVQFSVDSGLIEITATNGEKVFL